MLIDARDFLAPHSDARLATYSVRYLAGKDRPVHSERMPGRHRTGARDLEQQ